MSTLPTWDFDGLTRPWEAEEESIYSFLLAATRTAGGEPIGEIRLPDDAVEDGGIRFVAGAEDNLFGPSDDGTTSLLPKQLSQALIRLHDDSTEDHFRSLYRLVQEGIVQVIDDFVAELRRSGATFDIERLASIGRCLAREAPQRGAVKFGIALLGLCGHVDSREDATLLRELGVHEEFTLFVAFAMQSRGAGERALFDLAKTVHGWGRIELVDHLAETEDPEIQRWLLREGYKNTILYGYTDLVCAEAGGLLAALSVEEVDLSLLTNAMELLSSLLWGPPSPGIEAYADGDEALRLFVGHVRRLPPDPSFYSTIKMVRGHFAKAADADELLIASCDEYLSHNEWPELVRSGLQSTDSSKFCIADAMAKDFEIDTFDLHLERAEQDPAEGNWWRLMQEEDASRVLAVLTLAESVLPLAELSTGAEDSMGGSDNFRLHTALDCVVQDLGRVPGEGLPLLLAGLESPVNRTRNMAVKAASIWGRDVWPRELEQALTKARDVEPVDWLRRALERCLQGKEWSPS